VIDLSIGNIRRIEKKLQFNLDFIKLKYYETQILLYYYFYFENKSFIQKLFFNRCRLFPAIDIEVC
jgi:hypothetical protein